MLRHKAALLFARAVSLKVYNIPTHSMENLLTSICTREQNADNANNVNTYRPTRSHLRVSWARYEIEIEAEEKEGREICYISSTVHAYTTQPFKIEYMERLANFIMEEGFMVDISMGYHGLEDSTFLLIPDPPLLTPGIEELCAINAAAWFGPLPQPVLQLPSNVRRIHPHRSIEEGEDFSDSDGDGDGYGLEDSDVQYSAWSPDPHTP